MSQFFDKSSLTLIPSGYKDGKLYSQKPLSTSGELSFSRGSDIEATRVAANGYIEKAKVNLLLQSNTFSTTWTASNATLTSGQSGYDGTTDAWLLDKSGTQGRVTQAIAQSNLQCLSVYAKKGTSDYMRMFVNGPNSSIYFDLTDGSVQSSSSIVSGTATALSGGWYRCEVSFTGTTTAVNFYPAESGSTAGTSGNIYIQDAQLNYGLVAQTYQETTTAAVVSGITDNMPRLNYDPANPTCPSLLLEKSSTNEIPNSEYLSAWGASNVSVTQNTAISPEGVQNASTIEVTTQTASQGLAQGFVADGTSYYTISGYYKKTATSQRAQLKIRDFLGSGTTYGFVELDLSTGSVFASVGTYSITSFNSDWWYIQVTTGSVPSAGIRRAVIRLDNQTVGTQVTAYGIMVEKGTYATSYIPTYGSSATRTSDSASKTGISSLIGQSEGTLFIEGSAIANESTSKRISLSDGTNNNRVVINYRDSQIDAIVVSGGSVAVSSGTGITTPEQNHKIAIAYKQNDFKVYVDGVEVISDTSGNTFTSLSNFQFTDGNTTSSPFAGNIKQALLFTQRLSNSDLATLTSL